MYGRELTGMITYHSLPMAENRNKQNSTYAVYTVNHFWDFLKEEILMKYSKEITINIPFCNML